MPTQLPTVVLSPEFSSYSKSVIGQKAWQVGQWLKLQLPLPETMLIPHSTLDQILNHNSKIKLGQIKNLALPHKIKLEIIKQYHQFLGGKFVQLQLEHHPAVNINNVQGDANLIHDLIEIWVHALNQKWRPINVLVTKLPQADVSGVIYTHHPLAQNKTHYYVEAVAGIWLGLPEKTQKDVYQVDIRTQSVTHRRRRSKNLAYKRTLDATIPSRASIQADQFLLNNIALKTLSHLTRLVALHEFKPLKIQFSIHRGRVYFEKIDQVDPHHLATQSRVGRQAQRQTLPLRVNLKLTHVANLTKLAQPPSGILFSHQPTITSFGFYPPTILHQKQARLLKLLLDRQWQKLNHYLATNHFPSLFFKLVDLTALDWQTLKLAPTSTAINPDLGLRGALSLLHNQQLLEFELDTLKRNLHSGLKLNLVLPFVRTNHEANQLIKLIQARWPKTKFNFWLELASFDAIDRINQYPLRKLAGLVISTKQLQASLVGFDPRDHYLNQVYSAHTLSLVHTLNGLAQTLTQQPKPLEVIIDLDPYRYELVELATRYHWQLLTTRFELDRVKLAVADNFRRQLNTKQRKKQTHGKY